MYLANEQKLPFNLVGLSHPLYQVRTPSQLWGAPLDAKTRKPFKVADLSLLLRFNCMTRQTEELLARVALRLAQLPGGGALVAQLCPDSCAPWTGAPQAPLSMGFSLWEENSSLS